MKHFWALPLFALCQCKPTFIELQAKWPCKEKSHVCTYAQWQRSGQDSAFDTDIQQGSAAAGEDYGAVKAGV
jgi:hypothetical protein